MRLTSLLLLAVAANAWAEEPSYAGKLAPEVVKKVIRRNNNQVRFCFESQLANAPGLNGRVLVKFVVNAEGKVTQPMLSESTIENEGFESCLLKRLATWVFPRPEGGEALVTFPFTFTSAGLTEEAAPEPTGTLDQKLVNQVVQQKGEETRRCFASLPRSKAKGQLLLEFVVAPSGEVSQAKILGASLANAEFEGCVLDTLRSWVFPKPKGGAARVTFPFNYEPTR
jgi:TonB family protein